MGTDRRSIEAQPTHRRHTSVAPPGIWAAIIAMAGLAAIAVPMILAGNLRGRGAFDQINYHEIVIRTFADQWPRPDLSSYLSATTPGYHLILAAFARLGITSTTGLQLIGSSFSLLLVGVMAAWCARRTRSEWIGGLLALPFAVSLYVATSAIWLLPDNAGWLGVLVVIIMALRPRVDRWTFLVALLALPALVMMRQIHLWSAGVLWASAWLALPNPTHPAADRPGLRAHLRWLPIDRPKARAAATAAMMLATFPAFAIVLCFYRLWGGHLTPPPFVFFHNRAWNPSAPVFMLAILAFASVPFLPLLEASTRHIRDRWRWVVACACAGLALSLCVPTTSDETQGRFSGLWAMASILPTVGSISPAMCTLAAIGASFGWLWLASIELRSRWIFAAALLGYAAATAASFQVWQRYVEPMMLMVVLMAAAQVHAQARSRVEEILGAAATYNRATQAASPDPAPASRHARSIGRLVCLGSLALAVVAACITIAKFSLDAPAMRRPHPTPEQFRLMHERGENFSINADRWLRPPPPVELRSFDPAQRAPAPSPAGW